MQRRHGQILRLNLIQGHKSSCICKQHRHVPRTQMVHPTYALILCLKDMVAVYTLFDWPDQLIKRLLQLERVWEHGYWEAARHDPMLAQVKQDFLACERTIGEGDAASDSD